MGLQRRRSHTSEQGHNIQFSPGRSFQSAQSRIYELVPYLKHDGNRHDFSHTIHYMYFTPDDEAGSPTIE